MGSARDRCGGHGRGCSEGGDFDASTDIRADRRDDRVDRGGVVPARASSLEATASSQNLARLHWLRTM